VFICVYLRSAIRTVSSTDTPGFKPFTVLHVLANMSAKMAIRGQMQTEYSWISI